MDHKKSKEHQKENSDNIENPDNESFRSLIENNPILKKAHEQYIKFVNDPECMEAYEARMKQLRDQNSLIQSAEKRAHLEDARRMLEEGFELDVIQRITGLSKADLHQTGFCKRPSYHFTSRAFPSEKSAQPISSNHQLTQ